MLKTLFVLVIGTGVLAFVGVLIHGFIRGMSRDTSAITRTVLILWIILTVVVPVILALFGINIFEDMDDTMRHY